MCTARGEREGGARRSRPRSPSSTASAQRSASRRLACPSPRLSVSGSQAGGERERERRPAAVAIVSRADPRERGADVRPSATANAIWSAIQVA